MILSIKHTLLTLTVVTSFVVLAGATTLLVPAEYTSIQQAIDNAADGDTVLVAPGTYVENIIFRGKNIVLTSRYLVDENYDLIFSTLIDGSSPAYADSASTVRFMHGEDTTAVIEGFTITGGSGTVHPDVDPSYVWREGGGIMAYYASPTIRNNYITANHCENSTGLNGAGGGGVAFFKSHNPQLINNIITFNTGNQYAPGVSVDKAGAVIRNNIIARNSGANTYGGGGIWVLEEGSYPVYVDNNTVVWNESGQKGAGLYVWNGDVTAQNNIFWGNEFTEQVHLVSGALALSYSLVQNGYSAGSNILTDDPLFENNALYLSATSPAVDGGSESGEFNDLEDSGNPGTTLPPARGSLRNDAGAFGGPYPLMFSIEIEPLETGNPSALEQGGSETEPLFKAEAGLEGLLIFYQGLTPGSRVELYSLQGNKIADFVAENDQGTINLSVTGLPPGQYILSLMEVSGRRSQLVLL